MQKKYPLIFVKDLEKTYFTGSVKTRALRGVSFNISKGEFVAIMGPSGSGKSTLLHILGFLDNATGGTYLFDGKSFDDYNEDEIAKIRNQKMGFVFQNFNLLKKTTVEDNIKLPLIYSDIPEKKWQKLVDSAIKAVGLEHRKQHRPSQLSGGERQRVAIARALINNPDVIFADEPTGNLDSKSGQMIMKILQDLHDKYGHTILLITHETYTAEHAQRIIKLKDGKLESDTKVNKRLRADYFFK